MARVAFSSVRHCTAMAPCPGAGRISSSSSHWQIRPASPSRTTPAPARTVASYSPDSTFLILVSTFPLMGRITRSGRRASSWACLRVLLDPITAPPRSVERLRPSREMRTSRASSRPRTAPTHSPSGSSTGRSLSECTAMSISRSRSALWMRSVKTPSPPISGSGRSGMSSPRVSIVTISHSTPRTLRSAATFCACHRASREERVPRRSIAPTRSCSNTV